MKRTFDTKTADRIRDMLVDQKIVAEKEMFNGLCFMVDDKMCICVSSEDLLCRIGAHQAEAELEKGTCRQMIMSGRVSKDFVYVPIAENMRQEELFYWVKLCLDYNPLAKSSKKKK